MQIYATFDHSLYVELTIAKLEKAGIHNIFAVPLDNPPEKPKLFDTIHRSDGESLINTGIFLAVIFSVIGASRGFELKLGPIYWGLIGAGTGLIVGFLIDWLRVLRKRKKHRLKKGNQAELILIIECTDEEGKQVEKILWDNLAFGVAKIKTST